MIVGTEWLIEAAGCDADILRDESRLRSLMDRVIDELGLTSVGSIWHKFDGEGGVTGLIALDGIAPCLSHLSRTWHRHI